MFCNIFVINILRIDDVAVGIFRVVKNYVQL
jgi:hypothetical protein